VCVIVCVHCRQEVMQLLAELTLCRLDIAIVEECISPVYDQLIVSPLAVECRESWHM